MWEKFVKNEVIQNGGGEGIIRELKIIKKGKSGILGNTNNKELFGNFVFKKFYKKL